MAIRSWRYLSFILLAGCSAPLAAGAAAAQNRGAARPNIVFIMTDDAGYADYGPFGARDIRTPSLDRLAVDGIRMTQFYANGPVCSPTRAGLISGRYQSRYGIDAPLGGPQLDAGLPASGRSLPQLLKNAGYATALVGKWHLGMRGNKTPNAHGFEYFYGFLTGYIDYYQHTTAGGRPDFWENDQPLKVEGYATDLIADRSVRYIRDNASRPFFLSVQFNAPHWPFQDPNKPSVAPDNAAFVYPYTANTNSRQEYVAIVERLDEAIGRVLRALDDAGVAGNTLVIFTNDNGGEWLSDNGMLFNRKGTVWEGGIRVPALVRWPGRIPAGRSSSQVGISMDLTATMLAAGGVQVPADARHEGVNLLPVLEGRTGEFARTLFWRDIQGGYAVRSGNWKLVRQGEKAFLYDLATDAGERNDLAKFRPAVAADLWKQLNAWRTDVDAESAASGFRDAKTGLSTNTGRPPGVGGGE